MTKLIIDNIETDYDINELGEIYSHKTNKILTGTVYNTGYKMVRLTIEGKKKGYAIHRLVAQTFIPNPDNLPVVNHKDGNKLNNHMNNLEWVSQSKNRQHAIQTKISKLATGKREKIKDINENDWIRYKDTTYLVSIDGEVYNEKTKILLKQTPNNSGYIRYTLRINGKNISKLAHILVMETWGKQKLASNQVINHKDGNKTNNNLKNLEICSKSENALHSCYILKNNVKPVIRIINENEIQEYPSIKEAARQLKVTDGAIRYALKNNSKCCQSYWKYK
ncbi:HNH endonuclease [Megamonas funiformis]|uniref:HNH endonuclease n=1 Tax=Megamonas funiformis TaxID=437897 RepID=UPI003F8592DF